MLLVHFLVPLVVLATRVAAGPTIIRHSDPSRRISFPISRQINGDSKLDLIQRDRKHPRKSVKDGLRRSSSTPNLIVNDTSTLYVIGVGIGTPLTSCESC
jgi:hypothetical protein